MAYQQEKTAIASSGSQTFTSDTMRTNRIFTVAVTGSGTATIRATHLDNDPQVIATGVTAATPPLSFFGVGFTSITIDETGGVSPIDVTIAGSEK